MLNSVKWLQASVLIVLILVGCGRTSTGATSTIAPSAKPSPTRSIYPDVAADLFAGRTPTPAPSVASATPTQTTLATFGQGTKIVGVDARPGTYKAPSATTGCRWERLSGFGGTTSEVITGGTANGPTVVTISPTDAGFASSGCGEWTSDLAAVAAPPPSQSPTALPVPPNTPAQPATPTQGLQVVIVTSTFAQVIAHVTPGAICSASATVVGVPNLLSPSTRLATNLASDGLAVVGWLLPSFPNNDAAYSNTVTCSFAGQTRSTTQVAVRPTFASPTPRPTQGPLRTETFSGTLSGAAGVAYKRFTITLATPGSISASLDWSSSTANYLNLNLSRHCAACPPGADTTVAVAQTGKPRQLNYRGESGTYFLEVYIYSGTANFTLTVTHP